MTLSENAKLYLKSLVKKDANERWLNCEFYWNDEIEEIAKELDLDL